MLAVRQLPGARTHGLSAAADQVNLGPLPKSLQGRGEVDIRVSLDGQEANAVAAVIE